MNLCVRRIFAQAELAFGGALFQSIQQLTAGLVQGADPKVKAGDGNRCRHHAPPVPQARRHVIDITGANLDGVIGGLEVEAALAQQVELKHIMLMPE